MRRRGARHAGHRQRGAALLVMLVVVILGASWFALTRLASGTNWQAAARLHNGEVLARAKHALIGYVALKAAEAGERNPGRLPCPEAPGYYGDPAQEGIAAGSCTLPKVGRLPWRTLGLDRTVDAAGEPLWYAVSKGWAYTSANLTINSDTPGQLTVDGTANDAVALLIAPGAAFSVPPAPGCAAWTQVRPVSGTPDVRNYLECANADSDPAGVFATAGPSGSFNDQVLRVTAEELLAAIEAAVAVRVEREVVPRLRSVYAGAEWSLSSVNPVFPYAAPFSDPASADYRGGAGIYEGLLPFSANQGCNPPSDARCSGIFVGWDTTLAPSIVQTGGGGTILPGGGCAVSAASAQCIGFYSGSIQLRMSAVARNVAMALRRLDPTQTSVEYGVGAYGPPLPGAASGAFASDGSATIRIDAVLPDLAAPVSRYRIAASAGVLADHALLDPGDPTTGWFVRNQWYRFAYYALAANHAASGTPPRSCTASPLTCLSVANVTPANQQRAILVLAGRRLFGQTRPSGNRADFLEFGNAASPAAFEKLPVSTAIASALKKPFNDRIIVVDANP